MPSIGESPALDNVTVTAASVDFLTVSLDWKVPEIVLIKI